MLDVKAWISKVSTALEKWTLGCVNSPNLKFEWKSGSVTSNSSGLINLSTAFEISTNNAVGITVNCATAGYKVSGITAWNGYWYGILSPYNSASVSPNTTVRLIASWYHS